MGFAGDFVGVLFAVAIQQSMALARTASEAPLAALFVATGLVAAFLRLRRRRR